MLDINLIREQPEIVRDSQRRRGADPEAVDRILALDREWRETLTRINQLRHLRNSTNKEIVRLKKEGKDASEVIVRMRGLSGEIKALEQKVKELLNARDTALMVLPNLLDPAVPEGKDEEDNLPLRFHGTAMVAQEHLDGFLKETDGRMNYREIPAPPISHVDILEKAGLADIQRAGKVAGARFYYLFDSLVVLDLALQHYALDFMYEKGYRIVMPPYMLNRRAMEGVTDLSAFEETIYRIEGEDHYLIATAEHPIAAMFMDEILETDDLPVQFAGVSPCFRKEAGAHGKDTKGIFRVHQFNKVEQFVFCRPEESGGFHEELMRNAEEIFQSLGLPYRVVNVCSGDIGAVASKKYDLEAWMPVQGRFREMVSASNALDYQARRLNIRYRTPGENVMVHTVNSTAIATSRAIVAIIENFQEEGVIRIPKVLHRYTGFEEIPFRGKPEEG